MREKYFKLLRCKQCDKMIRWRDGELMPCECGCGQTKQVDIRDALNIKLPVEYRDESYFTLEDLAFLLAIERGEC